MIVKPQILDLSCPALIDKALKGIQDHLTAKLSWLNYAFGKSEKQIDSDGNVYPAIYQGFNNYINMLPDSHLGNYCFFEVEDGQDITRLSDYTVNDNKYQADFNLIFWFDFREVYEDHERKTIENVKEDVLAALIAANLYGVSLEVTQIYDRAENIYQGYDRAAGSYGYATKSELNSLKLLTIS